MDSKVPDREKEKVTWKKPPVPVRKKDDGPVCLRFPGVLGGKICGCTFPCRKAMKNIKLSEILPGLYAGPVQCAFMRDELFALGVRHVLNISSEKYTEDVRFRYRKYRVMDDDRADTYAHMRSVLKSTEAIIQFALEKKRGSSSSLQG